MNYRLQLDCKPVQRAVCGWYATCRLIMGGAQSISWSMTWKRRSSAHLQSFQLTPKWGVQSMCSREELSSRGTYTGWSHRPIRNSWRVNARSCTLDRLTPCNNMFWGLASWVGLLNRVCGCWLTLGYKNVPWHQGISAPWAVLIRACQRYHWKWLFTWNLLDHAEHCIEVWVQESCW